VTGGWTHLHGLPPVPPHAPRHPVPVTTRPPRRPSTPAGAPATVAGILVAAITIVAAMERLAGTGATGVAAAVLLIFGALAVAGRIGARRAGAAT
jgi:hypothetical protein